MDFFAEYSSIYEMPLDVQSQLFKHLAEKSASNKGVEILAVLLVFGLIYIFFIGINKLIKFLLKKIKPNYKEENNKTTIKDFYNSKPSSYHAKVTKGRGMVVLFGFPLAITIVLILAIFDYFQSTNLASNLKTISAEEAYEYFVEDVYSTYPICDNSLKLKTDYDFDFYLSLYCGYKGEYSYYKVYHPSPEMFDMLVREYYYDLNSEPIKENISKDEYLHYLGYIN